MLDPDISTERAKYLLSASPSTTARRRARLDAPAFLQAIGLGVVGGMAVGSLGEGSRRRRPRAWAGTPIGPNDGILVVIVLYGGNDGLNTVVPYTERRLLRDARRTSRSRRQRCCRSTRPSGSTPSSST